MSKEAVEYPIDGTLDLHTFPPKEVKDVVAEYLRACRKRGILTIRIIHGKGKGTLREIVRSQLRKTPFVLDFRPADASGGGWGATLVRLRPEK